MSEENKIIESRLYPKILIRASEMGSRLFRNQVGTGYHGREVIWATQTRHITLSPGDVVIRGARRFHCGMCSGSSDLIGITPVVLPPSEKPRTVGIFTACEVKTTARSNLGSGQANFIHAINSLGGMGFKAISADDFETKLTQLRQSITG